MERAELEEAKREAGISGWLSPREFATVAGIGEGTTRTAIRERTIEFVKINVKNQDRVFINPAEVLRRHLPRLMAPATRAATIEKLRRNAEFARVDFDFDEIERSIQLLVNAMAAQPVEDRAPDADAPVDPWGSGPVAKPEPVAKQLELVASGD